MREHKPVKHVHCSDVALIPVRDGKTSQEGKVLKDEIVGRRAVFLRDLVYRVQGVRLGRVCSQRLQNIVAGGLYLTILDGLVCEL